jgi:DNA-binding transcriptional LysR family regulator
MEHYHAVMFTHLPFQSGMSLERLASLCEVAEAGSIGQASRGDANRQSLLSRQIGELEHVFGFPFLDRTKRPYRLTPQASELARATLDFLQAAEDLRSQGQSSDKRIVMGAGEALIQWVLFPACELMKRTNEEVTFVFRNLDSERIIDGLSQGELDIALIRREEVPPSLSCSRDWRYSQFAFVPRQLSEAARPITAKDLQSLPWAVLEGHGHFRQFLETKASEAKLRLRVALECSSYSQIALAVKTGRYAGMLPEFARPTFGENNAVITRTIEPSLRYERNLVLAWRDARLRARPFLHYIIKDLSLELGRALTTY